MQTDTSIDYIDSIDYEDWSTKIKDIIRVASENESKAIASRRLRYSEVDVEGERKAGRIAPDELYIPMHISDTNIRREQSSYVQYVTQSSRAVTLTHVTNPELSGAPLELDVTNRLRFDGWQLSMYANIDGMQQNGYSVMEVVFDENRKGEVAHECVPLGDFGFINDSKDLQECEILVRKYYFSKTKLLNLVETFDFDKAQVDRVIGTNNTGTNSDAVTDKKDKSLFVVYKVMFRIRGVVHVAWANDEKGDDWLRTPRPLYLGRERVTGVDPMTGNMMSENVFETHYPYVLFPYLISENSTISQLKGRVYLDQDVQEASSSLLSSFCTAHRRAAGLYFSKDTDDPNDDIALQKNVFFRTGALINKKIQQFQLSPPGADTLSAVQTLITANMQETSQVNFAAQNRQDSRKTATEMNVAQQQSAALSTVQVVLFSNALRSVYQLMFEIVRSRVIAGLIKDVNPIAAQLYQQPWQVKPSGDTDVIERQQIIQQMMQAWPVMQNTPANQVFLADLITRMFPADAPKYLQAFQQAQMAQQQQQMQQNQAQQQQIMQMMQGIIQLSKHPEFFSDEGKSRILPSIEQVAGQLEQAQKQQPQPR